MESESSITDEKVKRFTDKERVIILNLLFRCEGGSRESIRMVYKGKPIDVGNGDEGKPPHYSIFWGNDEEEIMIIMNRDGAITKAVRGRKNDIPLEEANNILDELLLAMKGK